MECMFLFFLGVAQDSWIRHLTKGESVSARDKYYDVWMVSIGFGACVGAFLVRLLNPSP